MHSRALVLMAVVGIAACATSLETDRRSSESYQSEQVTVVIRSEQGKIDEVELHGLLGSQVLTASGESVMVLPDGTFEVNLGGVAQRLRDSGATEVATLLKNRGLSRILFDKVGDVALRARVEGRGDPSASPEVWILNRASSREPASMRPFEDRWIDRGPASRF